MGFRELPRESPYGKKHVVSKKKKEQICAAPENFDSYMSMPWDPSDEP
jgi:hypothetical protein